jgi:hypothetical protein
MPQDVFDDGQLTSMTAAIDLVMSEVGVLGGPKRHDVAHAGLNGVDPQPRHVDDPGLSRDGRLAAELDRR